MSDTVGSLVDKLFTVDSKMWSNQELLYQIRKLSFEEFRERFFTSEEAMEELWLWLKKACDLNLQRNQLIDEIDEKVVEIIDIKLNGENLGDGKFIQRKHKTY